ncbi:hypothetical protein MPER_05748 [Moniliophthora perniciosa FA553]|nr:hypothetical protein MPER_05748 [Moniliophthora perniciosa FA553]
MREEPRFGEEDPLYFPQPFTSTLAHLALIPLPSMKEESPYFIAWDRPTEADFVLVNPDDKSGSSEGLGILTATVRAKLQSAIDTEICRVKTNSIPPLVSGNTDIKPGTDTYVMDYTHGLRWMMAQLNCASTFRRSAMTFALAQRVYLEMVARMDWLNNYEPHYRNIAFDRSHEVARVVGALVGNVKTAETLWRLGIPLWLVRNVDLKDPNLRVDEWVEQQDAAEGLATRTGGFRLSFNEADPPNPIIWSGTITTTDFARYAAMARVLRHFAIAHLYEEEESQDQRPRKRPRIEPPPPPKNVRNKFDEVPSDIMPHSLKPWRDSAHDVGQDFNPNSHHKPLGYFLPDPKMIAGLGHDTGKFGNPDSISHCLVEAAPCAALPTKDHVNKAFGTQPLEDTVGNREIAVQGCEIVGAQD